MAALFDKERRRLKDFMLSHQKFVKKDEIFENILKALHDIPFQSYIETMSSYMECCRENLRELQAKQREKTKRGVVWQVHMMINEATKDT